MNRAIARLVTLVAAAALAAGCAAANAQSRLYAHLGGEPAVTAAIGETIDEVAADPRLNQSFDKVNLGKLEKKIVAQVCVLAGGGCVNEGDNMKQAHAGLNISEAEMYGLVEALVRALDRHGVGLAEKNQLLALQAPMKRDVVTR